MSNTLNIAALVGDLQPVATMRSERTLAALAAVTVTVAVMIRATIGYRADLMAGNPDIIVIVRGVVLLALGGATAFAVTSMAYPAVGRARGHWSLALALAALFPLTGVTLAVMNGSMGSAISGFETGINCLSYSLIGAASTAVPMVMWLRKGAPTAPVKAGWLTGVASGGLGAFAYSLHCPSNDVIYIGLWYGLAVGISALFGRLIVPSLIRW